MKKLLLVVACMLPFSVFASGYNPLKVGTLLKLPSDISNVGQAAQFILAPTGYKIVIPEEGQKSALEILNRPVSPVAAKYGLTTIENALLVLIGGDSRLVVDHNSKRLTFESMPGATRADQ